MYLVDTNILCDDSKPAPDARIGDWVRKNEALIYVSAVTLGEIQRGIAYLDEGAKKRKLREWLQALRLVFSEAILPVDEQVALRWGLLTGELKKRGRIIPVIDSLLAATALEHNLTLVTANTKDFISSGVKLLNPQ
jgi:toxin FitB